MNDELRVGEIGVLQNLDLNKWRNGLIAEIMYLVNKGDVLDFIGVTPSKQPAFDNGYVVDCMGSHVFILKDQIRRLSDPDAQQSIEEEKELCLPQT